MVICRGFTQWLVNGPMLSNIWTQESLPCRITIPGVNQSFVRYELPGFGDPKINITTVIRLNTYGLFTPTDDMPSAVCG